MPALILEDLDPQWDRTGSLSEAAPPEAAMSEFREALWAWTRNPVGRRLVPILLEPTSRSSAGHPYMKREGWERFRDTVPHLFRMGLEVLRATEELERASKAIPAECSERESFLDACRVARQVVLTAAVTAPPDLWLLRHVLGFFSELGLVERLLRGDALYPESCWVRWQGAERRLDPQELDADLHFLLSRGLVEQYDNGFRAAGHPRVREVLGAIGAPAARRGDETRLWRRLFERETLAPSELEALAGLGSIVTRRSDWRQNHWIPSIEEVELGYRLVPLVLGLRASQLSGGLTRDRLVKPIDWSPVHKAPAALALEILAAAGWMEREAGNYRVTVMGDRGFARAPGPFGIIESYHPYMSRGAEILLGGRKEAWVRRGENVGASQDANRATFEKANDSLDRFCESTGFRYDVFIEHAIGRGEATRQRYQRSATRDLRYVGADLEDAAIDAAITEQERGALPPNMLFVRADIGEPAVLLHALHREGIDPHGAVMLVGNGFHEVRHQTDEKMAEVFRGYHEAGVLLLFTEENALSIDDLRATAWNTYHAGFKYVHEKSGQGLRPSEPRPERCRLGRPQVAPWSECASKAGYVRADAFCTRTRTIYPYPPRSGHNPSISMNHFFVPAPIARRLGLTT